MSKANTLEEACKNVNDAVRDLKEQLAELPPVKESLNRLSKKVNDARITFEEAKKRIKNIK